MGEIFPVLVVLAAILVIIIAIYLTRTLKNKQAIRPLDSDELIARQTINITSDSVDNMAKSLIETKAKAESCGTSCHVDWNISDKQILRIVVDPNLKKITKE